MRGSIDVTRCGQLQQRHGPQHGKGGKDLSVYPVPHVPPFPSIARRLFKPGRSFPKTGHPAAGSGLIALGLPLAG